MKLSLCLFSHAYYYVYLVTEFCEIQRKALRLPDGSPGSPSRVVAPVQFAMQGVMLEFDRLHRRLLGVDLPPPPRPPHKSATEERRAYQSEYREPLHTALGT